MESHLLEDKFAEDGQGALVQGVGDHPPLEVVERAAGGRHPQLHHRPGELGAQSGHLEELVVVLEELAQEVDVLHQGWVSLLIRAADHDLAMRWNLQREPGHLVAVLGSCQLVHGIKEDEKWSFFVRHLQELFEEGSHRHGVVRDVLEGKHVGVGDLLTYRPCKRILSFDTAAVSIILEERSQGRGVWCCSAVSTHEERHSRRKPFLSVREMFLAHFYFQLSVLTPALSPLCCYLEGF